MRNSRKPTDQQQTRFHLTDYATAWESMVRYLGWDHLAFLTYRYPPAQGDEFRGIAQLVSCLTRRTECPVPWFATAEFYSGSVRTATHLNVLFAGTEGVSIDALNRLWNHRHGFSRFRIYDSQLTGARYACKYLGTDKAIDSFSSNFPKWYKQVNGQDYRDVLWSRSSSSGSGLSFTQDAT